MEVTRVRTSSMVAAGLLLAGVAFMCAALAWGGQPVATHDGMVCGTVWTPDLSHATYVDTLATAMNDNRYGESTIARDRCRVAIAERASDHGWVWVLTLAGVAAWVVGVVLASRRR